MKNQDAKLGEGRNRCACTFQTGDSSCSEGVARRAFLKTLTVGAAAALAPSSLVMAGPFDSSDFSNLVPADKKLDPAWTTSLFARGTPSVYRGAELEKIGMPVGGICAGQLYLGGDGRLWHWDIFNEIVGTGDAHYANPPKPSSPLEQGFAVRVAATGDGPGKARVRRLDRSGFSDVTFRGEYPLGFVEYSDPACPVAVSLEAFSPFVPLDVDNSSLPATVLRFTVKNVSADEVSVELAGWLENAVGLYTGGSGMGTRQNAVVRDGNMTRLAASAATGKGLGAPDVLFEDFQKPAYEGWETTGTAFGKGPILKSEIPAYQGDVGTKGPRVVNSHASAPGKSVEEKDAQTGTLTSRPFVIARNFIAFWIGGGDHPGKTCINLLIDGKVVRSATGHNNNAMRRESMDVRQFQGKTARLEIVDKESGPWGNIGIAEIVFTDRPVGRAADGHDLGTLALALLDRKSADYGAAEVAFAELPEAAFATDDRNGWSPGFSRNGTRRDFHGAKDDKAVEAVSRPFGLNLVGEVVRKFVLGDGQQGVATFVLAWHFPNLPLKDGGRYYATHFPSAAAVINYVAKHFESLYEQTRLWHDTWYDSTLPYWFLDRTMLNTSILATSTCHRFKTGRFYGWEGVGCCEGTCTHVWHYAHAVARLFPAA